MGLTWKPWQGHRNSGGRLKPRPRRLRRIGKRLESSTVAPQPITGQRNWLVVLLPIALHLHVLKGLVLSPSAGFDYITRVYVFVDDVVLGCYGMFGSRDEAKSSGRRSWGMPPWDGTMQAVRCLGTSTARHLPTGAGQACHPTVTCARGPAPRTGNRRRDDTCRRGKVRWWLIVPYPFRCFCCRNASVLSQQRELQLEVESALLLTDRGVLRFVPLHGISTPRSTSTCNHDRDIVFWQGRKGQNGNMDCNCPFWTMSVLLVEKESIETMAVSEILPMTGDRRDLGVAFDNLFIIFR